MSVATNVRKSSNYIVAYDNPPGASVPVNIAGIDAAPASRFTIVNQGPGVLQVTSAALPSYGSMPGHRHLCCSIDSGERIQSRGSGHGHDTG